MRQRTRNAFHWGTWLAFGAVLLGVAWWLLDRVEKGSLFMLALPFERIATESERTDARESARHALVPALVCVAAATAVLAWATRDGVRVSAVVAARKIAQLGGDHRVLIGLFLVATAADLATTLWFVHRGGLELEVHPGIRLFGYAFGRTAGPVLGKAVQCAGVVLLAAVLPRLARPILIVALASYATASAVNLAAGNILVLP